MQFSLDSKLFSYLFYDNYLNGQKLSVNSLTCNPIAIMLNSMPPPQMDLEMP